MTNPEEIEIVRVRGRNDLEATAMVNDLLVGEYYPVQAPAADSFEALARDMLKDMGMLIAFGVDPQSEQAERAKQRREQYALRLTWLGGEAR